MVQNQKESYPFILHLDVNQANKKGLGGLLLIDNDLQYALMCLDLLSQWAINPLDSPVAPILVRNAWFSAVVTYIKCFASSSDKDGQGRVLLDETTYIDSSHKEFHLVVKSWRNKYVGHSEKDEHDNVVVFAIMDASSQRQGVQGLSNEFLTQYQPSYEEIAKFTELVMYLKSKVLGEIEKRKMKIMDELSRVGSNDLYALIDDSGKGFLKGKTIKEALRNGS